MLQINKRIGTLVPLSALFSNDAKRGTFAAGVVFLDWLAKSKQTAWQLLPLHETQLQKGSKTIHVPSPYKGYGIGLDPKYLSSDDQDPTDNDINKFIRNNKYWISNYSLFCALRDYFGTDNWSSWPEEIRFREKKALKYWKEKLATEIDDHLGLQARLHFAYRNLRKNAKENNILLIGDFPFYLGMNGPLVWEYQGLFDIEKNGSLRRVSGVLKGVKSHFGRQIWGHPLYKWQRQNLVLRIYKLFELRIRYLAGIYDYIRFDHTKGLFSYGVIDMLDHKLDFYQLGPGSKILEKILLFAETKNLKIYAEDTGDKLIELRKCLHVHHVPGVKIFRFAYNEKRKVFVNEYLRTSKYPKNTVAYTTTHDTESLLGYLEKLNVNELDMLKIEFGFERVLTNTSLAVAIRNKVIYSPAKIVLIPMQDWLLTTDRINTPGTEKDKDDPNWRYVMSMPIEDLPIKFF